MNIKHNIPKLLLAILFLAPMALMAQTGDLMDVDVKGTGLQRGDALQDALRNAVSQAAGVVLKSETKVDNFVVVKDAIATRTQGYISTYSVTKETPFPDRVEMMIHAKVSLSPLKADAKLLAQSVGGIRFLVMYPRNLTTELTANYKKAMSKINEFLSQRQYRYIESGRFESLKKEAMNIMQSSDTTKVNYVQYLGIMSDAQFIIYIKNIYTESRSAAFDTRTETRVKIDLDAYDNCTAEGLGTVTLESDWTNDADPGSAIAGAVSNGFDKLLLPFNTYIGNWVNNGTPFELRFYTSGSYRDFRDLRTKMKGDANFGGDMEIVSTNDYTKLNLTFKKKPDELADMILDFADQVPAFKDKRMDVKLIYGRQMSFSPQGVKIPTVVPQGGNTGTNGNGSVKPNNGQDGSNGKSGDNGKGNLQTQDANTQSTTQPVKSTKPAPAKSAAPKKKVVKKTKKATN